VETETEPLAHTAGEHSEEMATLLDDLRQPISALLHDTELLANGSASRLESEQRSLLSRVRANVEHVSLLLGNLFTWRDVDAATLAFKPIPAHITHLLKQALDSIRFRLEARQLRTRLALGAVPVVSLDPDIVQRILINLLDMVCRLAQEGTTIGIQAFVEERRDRTAAAQQDLHIALSSSVALNSSGTAGAPSIVDNEIVHALVHAHGGRAWSSSQPDNRMVWHLTIPIHDADTRPGNGPSSGGDGRG